MKICPSLEKFPELDMWLKFYSEGKLEVFSGKVDHSVDIANQLYKRIYKILN